MWLQKFRFADKTISPVELLVLASVSDNQQIDASDIYDKLRNHSEHWKPERGTIYPILHRLARANLLERIDPEKMQFRRSDYGTTYLSSIPTIFAEQMESTNNYLKTISDALIQIDPLKAIEFLEDLEKKVKSMLKNIKELIQYADSQKDKNGWTQIEVD